ncbi:hypothetical protein Tco_1576896 [Tanacetum coccineum]
MGDENPIRTLNYSKPSHEGYRNTIELPVGNNVVPLRSDTIRLVQNGCSFHGLRTTKLRNDILMFQQHHGESLSEAWTRFKDLLQKVPHHGIDIWLQVQIFYDHVNPVTRLTIDQSAGGKLRDQNAKESWALLEDLALYDKESWNNPKDFTKLVKAITLPQDVSMNRITTPYEICSGPHITQYCMEDPEQAFVEYASSRTDEARDARLSKFEADFKQQQSEMTNKIDTVLKAITVRIAGALPSDTVKNPKLSTSLVLSARSYLTIDLQCSTHIHGLINAITIHPKQQVKTNDDSHKEEPEVGEQEVEYFDIFPTRSELAYHKYLMCGPIPSIFLRNPIITEGCPSNLKIPCNIRHVHMEKDYIDPNSPINIMTRMMYNWIMNRKLDPRENSDRGVSNFIGKIKGMHVFIGNFTYIIDFMIVEDISSIIDPRLSQVVLGRPFVEISNMNHDPPEGVVRFTNRTDEIAYKMPHKIEQYNLLSDLEKEPTKSIYLRNKEDKGRGVEYIMYKILGFYKECLELGPKYATGIDDEKKSLLSSDLTNKIACRKFLIKNGEEIFTNAGDGVRIYPDGVIFDKKKLGRS